MTKFGVVFLALLLATSFWSGIGRERTEEVRRIAPGVLANQRLTALVGAPVFVLLVAIVVTVLFLRPLLREHYIVGFLLIPPLGLKLSTTGYRFVRYYSGDVSYRLAGPPSLLLRLSAPVLVISTIAVFVSGVELWLVGLRPGSAWIQVHIASARFMMISTGVHLFGHSRHSAIVTAEEIVGPGSPEALTRRSFVVASLLLGAVLAVVSLLYATPFPPAAAGG